MTEDALGKVWIALFFCWFFCDEFMTQQKRESDGVSKRDPLPRYRRYYPALALPILLLLAVLYYVISGQWQEMSRQVPTGIFSIFIHISLFYGLLFLGISRLRERITARACAELWLLPSMLAWVLYWESGLVEPLLVIKLPWDLLRALAAIWICGAAGMFLKHVVSHFQFRRQILEGAIPMEDPEWMAVWQEEKANSNIRKDLKVVISDRVKTPLSIGLIYRTIRVVLPDRPYTKEELVLIFRHELIHIGRGDSGNKLFMVLCASLCWFNPLMGKAMEKSAEDIELSCDETVLLGVDAETRRRYGSLILHTAGEQRGFTTCLSATGESLRYRLKHIVKERRVRSGIWILGIFLFVFAMTCGWISVGYDAGEVGQVIFADGYSEYSVKGIHYTGTMVHRADPAKYSDTGSYDCIDEVAMKEYLSGLSCTGVAGRFIGWGTKEMRITLTGPQGTFTVNLTDRTIEVVPMWKKRYVEEVFVLDEKPDWEYIESLLKPAP